MRYITAAGPKAWHASRPLIKRAIRLRFAGTATLSLCAAATCEAQVATEPPAAAQPAVKGRADENAIRDAEDAFGLSVGRESLGLYTSSSVRGFSPIDAGNVRIDGLFFDQIAPLSVGVAQSAAIKVGLGAQNYTFPAPSGVVDYQLRTPGRTQVAATTVGTDSFGLVSLEANTQVALTPALRLATEAGVYRREYADGAQAHQNAQAIVARWSPRDGVQVVPFWSRLQNIGETVAPTYVPGKPNLPQRVPRRRSQGPEWIRRDNVTSNFGVLGSLGLTDHWSAKLGLFRSISNATRNASLFLNGLDEDGEGTLVAVIDPPSEAASTSGEMRMTRSDRSGDIFYRLHFAVRSRIRARRFGGSDIQTLGLIRADEPFDFVERRAALFQPQTTDAINQITPGVAFEAVWPGTGTINLGVQRTWYDRRVEQPAAPVLRANVKDWLYNLSAVIDLTDKIALYAGHTRGFEESGFAPLNAINRGEALPAIKTHQSEAGFRVRFGENAQLVAGVFTIKRPYFAFDRQLAFSRLGEIGNSGAELSFSGELHRTLRVVAGGVFLRPQVSGLSDADTLQTGPRAVGIATRTLTLNADWQVPNIEGLSLDISIGHLGPIYATRANDVIIPARTTVDAGVRYRFDLIRRQATLRVIATNLTDSFGYYVTAPGSYRYYRGRLIAAYLTVNFNP